MPNGKGARQMNDGTLNLNNSKTQENLKNTGKSGRTSVRSLCDWLWDALEPYDLPDEPTPAQGDFWVEADDGEDVFRLGA